MYNTFILKHCTTYINSARSPEDGMAHETRRNLRQYSNNTVLFNGNL
jgi:hypothetical protein